MLNSSNPSYRVHLGDGAELWIEVREADGSTGRVDLDAEMSAALARLGHGNGTGPSDGVEFATINADGPVRFFADGRRISTDDGLEAVAGGLIETITMAVRSAADTTAVS
jgi:hypothetical protein